MGNKSKRRGEWRTFSYEEGSKYPKIKRWSRNQERNTYLQSKARSRTRRAGHGKAISFY